MVVLDIPILAGALTLVQQILLIIAILFLAALFFFIEYLIFKAYLAFIVFLRDHFFPFIATVELIGKNLEDFKSLLQTSAFTDPNKKKDKKESPQD